ncbi:MAG TPA: Holliday junction resolvase RuvX [Myxococcota bacterium]|nr:Holliday junction resolvase RuvX [Myxococcota bacterium]
MVVLALDLGTKRIGLAVSDAEERIAFPAGALESRGHTRDVAAVGELIRERSVDRVVVGLPLHMSGRRGPEAEAAQRFADALAERTGVPVETLDERWTSREAERSLLELGRGSRKRARGEVDSMAATLLLRAFLERRTGGRRS